MRIKKIGLSDLFSQLQAGFRMVGGHPGRFALASVYTLLASVALAVLVIVAGFLFAKTDGLQAADLLQGLQEQRPETLVYVYAFMFLVYLLLLPLYAGWMVLCRQTANEAGASALTPFSLYAERSAWMKLAAYLIIGVMIYAATIYLYELLMLAVGIDMQEAARAMDPNAGGNPMAALNLGAGYWTALCFSIVLNFLLQYVLYLGFAHCALAQDGVFATLKAGFLGVLKNLLPIVGFTVLTAIAITVVVLIGILAAVVLAWLNDALAAAIGIPVLLLLLLYAYPVSFAFLYFFWKGILGSDAADGSRVSASDLSA